MNPHPVGTGPFAVVRHFGDQDYTLGRNPHYWLSGAPHFPCLERVLGSSSESAVLQMVNGDIDLTNNFVPHVEQAWKRAPTAGFDFGHTRREIGLVAITHRDIGTELGQRDRAGPTDPHRGSRHDRDGAVEPNRIWCERHERGG